MIEFRFFSVYREPEGMPQLKRYISDDATPTVHDFQIGHPTFIGRGALLSLDPLLNDGDVRRSRAFFPLLYVKGNSIAFSERLEAVSLDR